MPRRGECIPLAVRFWKKVRKANGCWLWTGSRFGSGRGERHRYGSIMVSKSEGPRLAHRVSWELANGQIPKGLQVCHSCDTPLCVRPSHLFVGTQKDNAVDMGAKKRNYVRAGENSPFAKLNGRQVQLLRKAYANRSGPVKDIIVKAKIMGIGRSQFYNIVGGKCWA